MATTVPKWTQVTISEPVGQFGFSRDVKLRTVKTGRGKAAVEIWQRYVTTHMEFDGATPEEAIKSIQDASAGLVDARLDIDYMDEYRNLHMIGWAEDVTEEQIAKGRAKIEADAAKAREVQASREAADREKLLELARQYPDALRGLIK